MIFESLVLENFATYKGRNEINLTPESEDKPIILIGGQNGCGKTTFLDAIQLVLFGNVARCSNRKKLSYEAYLERCINRDTPLDEGAQIELTFRFFLNGREKRYWIRRNWSKAGKKLKEFFTAFEYVDGKKKYDGVLSDSWSDYIEGVFPSQIAPFFFFDGEKIEELAEFEKSGPLIQAAIHSLLGLNYVDQLNADLTVLEQKKQKSLASDEELIQIDEIENTLKELDDQVSTLAQKEASITNGLDRLNLELDRINASFKQQGGELFDQRTTLEKEFQHQKVRVETLENELREIAAGAAPLLLVQDLLKEIEEQARKESNAQQQQALCEVLEARDALILEKLSKSQAPKNNIQDLSTFMKKERLDRQKSAEGVECYLNLDSAAQDSLGHLLRSELPGLEKQVPEKVTELEEHRGELEILERKLAAIPDSSTIEQLVEKRAALNAEINKQQELHRSTAEELQKTKNIREQKQAAHKRELEKAAKTRFENKDTRRVITYSGKVQNTLNIFREKIIAKHLSRIEGYVLESFRKLMRKESFIQEIKINPSTYKVQLFRTEGEEVLPERLSAGERQLLATALLWGICKTAGKPLPTIIDTPLGRLDSSHRKKMVQNYFPFASHQVVLLSTDEEIIGNYHEALSPAISQTFKLNHSDFWGTRVEVGYFN